MKKYDKESGKTLECLLIDDGTLDTVVTVDGKEYRFDSEYVARRQDGSIPAHELERLLDDAIDQHLTPA